MNSVKQSLLQQVFSPILKKGFSVLFVGGCVRDSFLGIEPHDFDITTSATPEELHTIFPSISPKSKNAEQYGTTIVLININDTIHPIEITTLRKDITVGRHPTVTYTTSILEDSARRDFTINALYEDIEGNIFDPTGLGKQDIFNKKLRFIGDPVQRLQEDPLRAFRFVRFLSQKGFSSAYADDVLQEFATQYSFTNVSKERQLSELKQILAGKYFTQPEAWNSFFSLGIVKEMGLSSVIQDMQQIPQSYKWHAEGSIWLKDDVEKKFEDFNILYNKGVPENIGALSGWVPIQHGNVWDHTKAVVFATVEKIWEQENTFSEQDRFEIVLGAFLHDIGKSHCNEGVAHKEYILFEGTPMELFISEDIPVVHNHAEVGISFAATVCKTLTLSNQEIATITGFVENHMKIHMLLEEKNIFKKRVLLNLPNFEKLSIIGWADDVGSLNIVPRRGQMEVILQDEEIKRLQALGPLEPPILTGDFLIEKGHAPSPIFAKVLTAAYKTQVNRNISNPEGLYVAVKNLFKEKVYE